MYYDILKASKVKAEVFPDYWTQLWGRKLSESMIKTLKGNLPLTFKTSEEQLRDWTIYGNNYEHTYSATGTLPLTFSTHTAGAADDWVIYGNDDNGTVNLFDIPVKSVTSNNDYYAEVAISEIDVISYFNQHIGDTFSLAYDIITEYKDNIKKELVIYFTDSTFVTIRDDLSITITKAINKIGIRARYDNPAGNGINYTFNHFMIVKGSTAPDHYIPYQQGVGEKRVDGYYVPLTVSQTGQTDKTYDIYIGSTPLTAGQSISKTSTAIDIAAQVGSNIISTTLYNKPSMSIEGVDYVGVGEPTNDGWQIPLTVSDGTNTTTVNVPIDAPLTASDTATRTSTGVDIPTYVGTNTIGTTLYNKPEMSITYKE